MLCERDVCLIEAKCSLQRSNHENAYHQNETLFTSVDHVARNALIDPKI